MGEELSPDAVEVTRGAILHRELGLLQRVLGLML